MKTRQTLADAINQAQKDGSWIYENMPRRTQTEGQEKLLKLHCSPYTFGKACVQAIGEISILEAQAAAEKYLREWNAAK